MQLVGHLIGGDASSAAERKQDVFNPATGEVAKQVAIAPRETVEEAIAVAQAAYPEWRNTPALKRARIMFNYKALLEKHADTICELIGAEHG